MTYDDMHYCFDNMKDKIYKAIDSSDLDKMFTILSSINQPTLVTGVGGSSIVATFLAKVLREKNKIIATFAFPRDMKYMDLSAYKNVIAVSYSGNNIGVDASFNNNLNKYLLTGNPKKDINNIVYNMDKEASYVSINATIIPLSLILSYYRFDTNIIDKVVNYAINTSSNNDTYEVMYGYETISAATLLESCISESGMAMCTIHEKYNFAHGRINLTKNKNSDLIFLRSNSEYDDLLADTLPNLYNNIITINSNYEDVVINDYHACVVCLKLIGAIADNKGVSISDVGELPQNDIFYLYKGEL